MVELYLNAKLHSRISEAAYKTLLTRTDLDDQDLKLRSDLLRQVDNGSIRLT
jgi:N-acetylmuramoyl-L-alanine amidase|tara:strand:+ start:410 stop:565 length:156 start_codon:yes stop_codon:yes gene_type:complete